MRDFRVNRDFRVENQHTPSFTGAEVTKLVAAAKGLSRVALILLAASGLRVGELFGLEVRHLVGNTISVEQSVWEGRVQSPKTKSALREVDLHPSVSALLRDFIGTRRDGFIFQTEDGTALHQSNFLRRSLHPLLAELGIEKQGFHGFRRFRVTHLETARVPNALTKYWTGHAKASDGEFVKSDVTDTYVKIAKNKTLRTTTARKIGLGFRLPEVVQDEVVPSVPTSEERQDAVSA